MSVLGLPTASSVSKWSNRPNGFAISVRSRIDTRDPPITTVFRPISDRGGALSLIVGAGGVPYIVNMILLRWRTLEDLRVVAFLRFPRDFRFIGKQDKVSRYGFRGLIWINSASRMPNVQCLPLVRERSPRLSAERFLKVICTSFVEQVLRTECLRWG